MVMKQVALEGSRFDHVLFLDADCFPAVDPTFLFDTIEFQSTGKPGLAPSLLSSPQELPLYSRTDKCYYLQQRINYYFMMTWQIVATHLLTTCVFSPFPLFPFLLLLVFLLPLSRVLQEQYFGPITGVTSARTLNPPIGGWMAHDPMISTPTLSLAFHSR